MLMGFFRTACSDFNCFGSSYPTIFIWTLTVKYVLLPASGEQNVIRNWSLIVYCFPKYLYCLWEDIVLKHYFLISQNESLTWRCTEDEDGVSFSSNFFQIIFYSDKYLAMLHTNYILHMHKNKCLPSEKRVRYFCSVLTKSNHSTNARLRRINMWTDIQVWRRNFWKCYFNFLFVHDQWKPGVSGVTV